FGMRRARPLLSPVIPRLLGQAAGDDGRRFLAATPQEAQAGHVSGFQPAVFDPDPRRTADSELAGIADQAAERSAIEDDSGERSRTVHTRRSDVRFRR